MLRSHPVAVLRTLNVSCWDYSDPGANPPYAADDHSSAPVATCSTGAWLHERALPLLTEPVQRIQHHHNVDDALAAASPASPAVLLPSPDFEQVQTLIESGGLLPEKATSFQPKPSLGVLMRPVTGG